MLNLINKNPQKQEHFDSSFHFPQMKPKVKFMIDLVYDSNHKLRKRLPGLGAISSSNF